MDVRGKLALVTGGSDGIGREIALQLQGAGADVIVTGRSAEKLQAMAALGFGTIAGDLSEAAGVDAGNFDPQVGDAPVCMGQAHAQFGRMVDFRKALACQEVESVEVVRVAADLHPVLRGGDGDDRFEQRPLSLLNVLSHRVQVGREGDAGREDSPSLLAFALAEELFPPFGQIL